MKKSLLILAVFSSFFIFQSALFKYDVYIESHLFRFTPDYSWYEFSIADELDADETADFQKNLLRLLDKYDLYCYQRLYIEQEFRERLFWVYSSDPYYLGNIPLSNGMIENVNPGDYYFSYDGDRKGTVLNPIRNEDYKIYHLDDFSSEYKSVNLTHILVSYAEDREKRYDDFMAELKELQLELSMSDYLINYHGGTEIEPVDNKDIVFAIISGLMVILWLNIIIVRQTKKIQVLKLEGYASLRIYFNQALKFIGLIILISIITNTALFAFYIDAPVKNVMPFIKFLLVSNGIFFVSLLVLSIASFAAISLVSINTAIKGRSFLAKQKYQNRAVKAALIIFTASALLQGIQEIKPEFIRLTTEQEYLNRVENLYCTPYIKPTAFAVSVSSGDPYYFDKAKAVKVRLAQENNYFEMRIRDDIQLGTKKITVILADQEYIRKYISQDLPDKITNGIYVLIPDNLAPISEQVRREASRYSPALSPISSENILIYPNISAPVFSSNFYTNYGLYLSNAVFIVGSSISASLSADTYFTYNGTTDEAQEYLDNLCAELGIAPKEQVHSVKQDYLNNKSIVSQLLKIYVPIYLMILFVIIINAYQAALLGCEIDDKRYALRKCEGCGTLTLIWQDLKENFLLIMAAYLILFKFMNFTIFDSLLIAAVYLITDITVLWLVTNYRTKHFAERLR